MKELVRHLIHNNLDTILNRSLLNCHALGLHSIMLLESPGQTIRLFVAEKGNELYKNSPYFYERGMSIGFHPHHCNLTLHCIKGKFWNWVTEPDYCGGRKTIKLKEYTYRSQITDNKQGFELINPDAELLAGVYNLVDQGESVQMQAHTLHTVACDPFELSAWLVYEGQEDPNYQPSCYSTSNLETASTDGLYQKASYEHINRLLKLSGLLPSND